MAVFSGLLLRALAFVVVVVAALQGAAGSNANFSVSGTCVQFGKYSISVQQKPFDLKILERTGPACDEGRVILKQSSGKSTAGGKLGYGYWVGKYLDLYEGYLTRIGSTVSWQHSKDVTSFVVKDDSVELTISCDEFFSKKSIVMKLFDFKDSQFTMEIEVLNPKSTFSEVNRIGIGFELNDADEKFFGFGEQFESSNQRGKNVGFWLEEGSWASASICRKLKIINNCDEIRIPGGALSTYGPMPFFISSRSYGVQVDSSFRTFLDMGAANSKEFFLGIENFRSNITFYFAASPAKVLEQFTAKVGRSLIPPLWQFAPWNQLDGENSSDAFANMTDVDRARQLISQDIPVSHDFRPVHFLPTGDQRHSEDYYLSESLLLKSNLGIKSTAYINAFVDISYKEVFDLGEKNGYFVKNSKGKPYEVFYEGARSFKVVQVDFTNPDAFKWYQGLLSQILDLGFSGWMQDYGEYIPHDAVFHNGKTGLEMHNLFPFDYQRASFELLTDPSRNITIAEENLCGLPFKRPENFEQFAPDFIPFVRSTYFGSQKYTWAHWTGDPSSDWSRGSGLPAQISAGLSIGMTGIPFSGSDIGGFEWYLGPPPTFELWARWTAMGTFSGLMREQNGGKGFSVKHSIFFFDDGQKVWRYFAKLRMQLIPYMYTAAFDAHRLGLPLMRHHVLHFPDDATAISQEYQYMFGPDLLVAPVIEEGATSMKVYLPRGADWYSLSDFWVFDSEINGRFRIGYSAMKPGGQFVDINVTSLFAIPLYVKAGSIIPVLDARVHTVNAACDPSVVSLKTIESAKRLQVWIFPDSKGTAFGQVIRDFEMGGQAEISYIVSADGTSRLRVERSSDFTGDCLLAQIIMAEEPGDVQAENAEVNPAHKVQSYLEVLKAHDSCASGTETGSVTSWTFDKELRTVWLSGKISSGSFIVTKGMIL